MAWETRGNKEYYYRKEWKNGKCVSDYIGDGELANLLSQWDRIDRAKKEIDAEKERQTRENFAEIDRDLDELAEKTKDLVESFLVDRGFYKTSSREWRLKNDK